MSPHPVTKRSILIAGICIIQLIAMPSYGATFPIDKNISQTVKPQLTPSNINFKKNDHNSSLLTKNKSSSLYTIQAGDTMYKILMREYGLTYRQAEKFIAIVRRENNISSYRRLKIGQKISISNLIRKNGTERSNVAHKSKITNSNISKSREQAPVLAQSFMLVKPEEPVMPVSNISANVKQMWEKIIPERKAVKLPSSAMKEKISISLDTVKYPILPAMDGGRILIDVNGDIPQSIKSIYSETNPGLRVINESAANSKRFLASLIESGKFYSTEENFVMQFGNDPKLTIRSDFKVERTAESMADQDIILLNAGKTASSPKLTEFLKKEGFAVYEPFALIKPHIFSPQNRLVQVASRTPIDIASAILKALSITAEEHAQIHIAGVDNSGISISITPDRYFNYKGKTYCITYPDKDAAVYNSLTPILEAKGIHSIVLNQNSDFREISERILTSVGLSGTFGFQTLWPQEDANYSLQMSGIMINSAMPSGESLFLTDRDIDRIIREISVDNGFTVEKYL